MFISLRMSRGRERGRGMPRCLLLHVQPASLSPQSGWREGGRRPLDKGGRIRSFSKAPGMRRTDHSAPRPARQQLTIGAKRAWRVWSASASLPSCMRHHCSWRRQENRNPGPQGGYYGRDEVGNHFFRSAWARRTAAVWRTTPVPRKGESRKRGFRVMYFSTWTEPFCRVSPHYQPRTIHSPALDVEPIYRYYRFLIMPPPYIEHC